MLQRLSMALAEVDQHRGDGASKATELELRGLSSAEFELIRAYLQRDSQWLSGWHAAAEEQALIARQGQRTGFRVPGRRRSAKRAVEQALDPSLSCALCGTEVHWPEHPGVAVCSACGSQLLRARQKPSLHRGH
ncbi:hypothetical protein [Stutzerimonas azotifigens]|uniref:DksA C4-type domain-containing protein n=1 Tax=Stutzerimonas azotifigens TaxID=291995 RepID=A0ABR5Z014_9GAMM|nr:hypothetical protein [Stutzerimonas azotifigens]MBA1273490.1 hypothetical protein [Stutzerimonas azotifigens]